MISAQLSVRRWREAIDLYEVGFGVARAPEPQPRVTRGWNSPAAAERRPLLDALRRAADQRADRHRRQQHHDEHAQPLMAITNVAFVPAPKAIARTA
jgi:hypothetical protein